MVRSTEKVVASTPDVKRARLAALSNLVKSKKPGHLEKYYQLLTDFNFLAEKINHSEFGVQALIADYDLIEEPPQPPLLRGENISLNPEKVKTLKRIQGALRLSAHILANDKTQLAGQLWGRMQGFDVPEIQQLLSQAKQSKTTWLRPLTVSLTSPGGRLLGTLIGHNDSVRAVAVTSDGKRAISSSRDNTLKVWNLDTGEELFTLKGHSDWVNAVAVTGDGKQAISGSRDNTLKVWNLETGEELLTLKGHSNWVNAVAVTGDGKRAISCSRDKTLKVWNLETGKKLFTLFHHSPSARLNRHTFWVNAVAVARDGKWAVSGSDDSTLKVWNLETGEELLTLEGHSSWVNAVAVTRDGKRAISCSSDSTLKVWNLETGKKLLALSNHSDDSDDSMGWACEDGMFVASSNHHNDSVRAVAVTGDGKRAISCSDDHTLKLWNLETGEELFTIRGHSSPIRAVAVTDDGKRAISCSDDHTLKLWNLETETEEFALQGHSCSVTAVAVTGDGKRAISCSDDHTLKLWNLETGKELFAVKGDSYLGTASGAAVAVTGDGKWAISGSYHDFGSMLDVDLKYILTLWNLETGEELFDLNECYNKVTAENVTRDGKWAISGSDDFTFKLWKPKTGEELFTFKVDISSIRVVPFYPSSSAYSSNHTFKVWNLKTGEELLTLEGHRNSERAEAVTADGKRAIFGSDDNTLKVWNLETGEVIARFTGESRINCCAVAPDGVTIVAGEVSGRVHFLRLEGMEASP